jgi:low temperature requirement protein LtrA
MGCILPIFALFVPRLSMFFIWLLTSWFGEAYETKLYPFLGWLFMPYTTLAYMTAMLQNNHELNGGWIVLLVVAVMFDLGGQSSSVQSTKK